MVEASGVERGWGWGNGWVGVEARGLEVLWVDYLGEMPGDLEVAIRGWRSKGRVQGCGDGSVVGELPG